MQYYEIDGKLYPVKDYAIYKGVATPVIDGAMMSDIKWQRRGLEDRFKKPSVYAAFENVQNAVSRLEKWLKANDLEYSAWRSELDLRLAAAGRAAV